MILFDDSPPQLVSCRGIYFLLKHQCYGFHEDETTVYKRRPFQSPCPISLPSSQRLFPLYNSTYTDYSPVPVNLCNSTIMKISLAVGIWATHMFQALVALPPTDPSQISVACSCPKSLSPCTTCTELPVDTEYTCKTECITKCFDLLNDPNNCGSCDHVVCNP